MGSEETIKKVKIEAIIEYGDHLPWDDEAMGAYIERQCKYTDPNPPYAEITVRVTKVERIKTPLFWIRKTKRAERKRQKKY